MFKISLNDPTIDLLKQLDGIRKEEKEEIYDDFRQFMHRFIPMMKDYIEYHEKIGEINDSLEKLSGILPKEEE